ncbi:hypothetical protein V8F33_002654 [Rhypophila sp. PSN 637]
MGHLPPAEKLPLAVRKNVRDEYEHNKADLEKQLSELLGETWTIDITPNAIWPYHNDGYAKESLGSCIKSYIEGAIYQFKYLTQRYGSADLAKEINAICHAHVLTLDVEETSPPRFSYGGCDVLDGKFRILFVEQCLGTNIDYACGEDNLFKALNVAPEPADRPMSFLTRLGIRTDYDPTIAETRHSIAELMGKSDDEVKLSPNFEESFAKLQAESKKKGNSVREDWEKNLGDFTKKYFEALAYHMKYIKVGEDDMIQEGFNEAVDKNEMAFRIVDKLSDKDASYNEAVIEDGILYLQCKPETWGVNIDYVAQKLMDLL